MLKRECKEITIFFEGPEKARLVAGLLVFQSVPCEAGPEEVGAAGLPLIF